MYNEEEIHWYGAFAPGLREGLFTGGHGSHFVYTAVMCKPSLETVRASFTKYIKSQVLHIFRFIFQDSPVIPSD